MEFEVPPTGLGSTRWYARIAVALAIGAVIVGVGFLARAPGPAEEVTPIPSVVPSVAAATPAPSDPSALAPRQLPPNLTCHGLRAADCTRAADAALRVL